MYTRTKKGFTLIEILVFMGVFVIAVGVFTDLLSSILNLRNETDSVSGVQQDGNFIISRIAYDIARASTIVTPSAAGLSGDTLQLTINGVPYTYATSGANLTVTTNGSTDSLNGFGSTVSGFTVTRLGNGTKDTIKLQFTVKSTTTKNSGLSESKTYDTTAGLR